MTLVTQWHTPSTSLPINDWAGCSECLHTPGCRFPVWISSHRGTLQRKWFSHTFNAFTPNIQGRQRCPHIIQLLHTDIQATVLHLFPVFQVHGPHVAIEQAGRVRDGVLSHTESDKNTVRTSTWKEEKQYEWNLSLFTFFSSCTPRRVSRCSSTCRRRPAGA